MSKILLKTQISDVTSFRITSGAVSGYILTSDSNGYGSWQVNPATSGVFNILLTAAGPGTTTTGNFYNNPAVVNNPTASAYYWSYLAQPPAFTGTGVTIPSAYTLYIAGPPQAGTSTITNAFSLYIASGQSLFGGNVSITGTSSILSIAGTTASTSATTGSVQLSGGLGINTATAATSATNGGSLTTAGGIGVALNSYFGANVNLSNSSSILTISGTTASTNTSTGAIVVTGGIGIGSNSFFGGNVTLNAASATLALSGASSIFTVAGTTAATSSTTGSVQLSGGVGIAKNIWLGTSFSNSISGFNGNVFNLAAITFTDSSTAASGTAASNSIYSVMQPTIAASNTVVTTTKAATAYFGGAPIKGTNQTFTNLYGVYIDSAASTGATVTGGASLYIVNAPTVTSGTVYALQVASGASIFGGTVTASNGFTLTTGALSLTSTSGAISLASTTFSTNTQVQITATTNQLVLGTTNTLTITSPAPAASRTYTIPDAGGAANFILSTFGSAQTIAGGLTSSGTLTASNGFTLTTGALSLTSTSGAISLAGTTFSTNTQIQITATTNQLVLGTTNTLTISSTAPAASRTYTIPDAGGAANFILSTFGSAQTIAGGLTSSGTLTASNGFTLTTGALSLTSTSGAISLAGTTFSTNTQIQITATTNQLVLGTTNTLTITSPAPAASRTYTIPDAGGAANFILSTFGSTQTIAGGLTSSGTLTASNGFTLTTGALNLTSTSGAISLTGTTFSTNTQVQITATTNQLVLGTTNTTTITAPAPAASRAYTIPDVGGTASFIMSSSTGGQTITGQFISTPTVVTGTTTLTLASPKYIIANPTAIATVNLPASPTNGMEFTILNVSSFTVTFATNVANNDYFDNNGTTQTITLNTGDRLSVFYYNKGWYLV